MREVFGCINHTRENLVPEFRMRQFTAAEHDRDLDLIALVQELPDVVGLGLKVVDIDFRPVLHFLDRNHVLMLLGFLGALALLILILAIIHDPAHGRRRIRRHFHQIETTILCFDQRVLGPHYPELIALLVNDADLARPDPFVDPHSDFGCFGDAFFLLFCTLYHVTPDTLQQGDKPLAHKNARRKTPSFRRADSVHTSIFSKPCWQAQPPQGEKLVLLLSHSYERIISYVGVKVKGAAQRLKMVDLDAAQPAPGTLARLTSGICKRYKVPITRYGVYAMLSRFMTRKEQLILLACAGALCVGAAALYFGGKGNGSEQDVAAIHPVSEPLSVMPIPQPTAPPPPAPVNVVKPALAPVEKPEAARRIAVAIRGEVCRPGVFEFEEGARVQDLLDKAGSATPNGDLSDINLAAQLIDGTTLTVPRTRIVRITEKGIFAQRGQTRLFYNPPSYTISGWRLAHEPEQIGESGFGTDAAPSDSDHVNLNTATAEELDQLPGIGPATAEKIIQYRAVTPFRSVQQLQEVSGIGPKKYEELRPLVTVQ